LPVSTPQPKYVGYPRSGAFGVIGLYGSSKQLEALRTASLSARWLGVVTPGLTMSLNHSHYARLDAFGVTLLAVVATANSILVSRLFYRLAEARGSKTGWPPAIGLFFGLSPIIWAWFFTDNIRYIGCFIVLCTVGIPIEWILRSETRKYGLKFNWKNQSMFDQLIEERRALEAGPPPVPSDLYLGSFVGEARQNVTP